ENSQKDPIRYAKLIVDRILNQKYNGKPLNNYIINDLTVILVKNNLQLYTDEQDPDRKIDINSIFEEITDFLVNNTVFPIKSDSIIIKNLNQYIYPYYRLVYTLFIKRVKSLIDNYTQYL